MQSRSSTFTVPSIANTVFTLEITPMVIQAPKYAANIHLYLRDKSNIVTSLGRATVGSGREQSSRVEFDLSLKDKVVFDSRLNTDTGTIDIATEIKRRR